MALNLGLVENQDFGTMPVLQSLLLNGWTKTTKAAAQ